MNRNTYRQSGNRQTSRKSASTTVGLSVVILLMSHSAHGDTILDNGDGGISTQGVGASATGSGSSAYGVGSSASGIDSQAYGTASSASGSGSTALGPGSNASGLAGTSIGGISGSSADFSTAIGFQSQATADFSTAIGFQSQATADFGVAIGSLSVADRPMAVSVGTTTPGQQRQIINVEAGTMDTDAVNVGQLNTALAGVSGFGGGVSQGELESAMSQSEQFAAQGVAAALAMPPSILPGVGKQFIGLQVGSYAGESAVGIGYTYQVQEQVVVNAAISSSPGAGKVAMRGGIGLVW